MTVSSMKASTSATSMVYHVGRAPEHGAGEGIVEKQILAIRCGKIYGVMAALVHTSVWGTQHIVRSPHISTGKATARSRVAHIMLSLRVFGRIELGMFHLARCCLNALSLHQYQALLYLNIGGILTQSGPGSGMFFCVDGFALHLAFMPPIS